MRGATPSLADPNVCLGGGGTGQLSDIHGVKDRGPWPQKNVENLKTEFFLCRRKIQKHFLSMLGLNRSSIQLINIFLKFARQNEIRDLKALKITVLDPLVCPDIAINHSHIAYHIR